MIFPSQGEGKCVPKEHPFNSHCAPQCPKYLCSSSPGRGGAAAVIVTFTPELTRTVLQTGPEISLSFARATGQEPGTGGCPPAGGCNEKRMLAMLPRCGKTFAERMKKVEVWKWCNLSEFIVYYESFTNCTEVETNVLGCYWPNPLAESFIAGVHRRFFQNCSVDRQHWKDPPDEILIPLIALPILLTVVMTGVVVWRSKRTNQVV
ncbi:receptor activity-modifying protein 3 [Mesoplodon densirostris]|uniref:receptor activity-modifying protein 3 n=1 Tax=Mesoplodon densirostris TaxID=48708 RepID=UPI0028DD009C|nr:receptor activity-modifying protein 3 [Mesoplodon densirostris]